MGLRKNKTDTQILFSVCKIPSSKIFVSVHLRKLDQLDEFDEILRQNGRGGGKNATDFRSLLAYSHLDFVYTKLSPEGIKEGQF